MKKITSVLFLALIAMACTAINSYNIKGELDDASWNGRQIALYGITSQNTLIGIDSTIIKSQAFHLSGKLDTVGWYVLMIRDDQGQPIYKDFYADGSLSCTFKNGSLRISGTKLNDDYQTFEDQYNVLTKDLVQLNSQLKADPENEALKSTFNQAYELFVKSFRQLALKTITENIQTPLGVHIFQTSLSTLENSDIESILKKATPEFLADPIVKMVVEQINLSQKVNEGNPCPDLSMLRPDGSPVSLSSYVGKGTYVLIDFWASWCGPCMRELPNVLACYEKYHAKGFEVVGVSLDEESEPWKRAIEKNKIPWPQMSDLAGWKSQAVAVFSFSSIPHTVLVDPKGIIIAKNLRGEALERKLADLFGK
jgi:peroxiredoxin